MGKKDKSNKTKELSKSEKKAAKAAKKAAKKEMNTSPPPAIHEGLLVDIASAQAKSILEKVARLPTTPDGTYTVVTNAGNVTIVKSTMSNGNARLTWLFNGEKSDKSKVYNALKVVSPLIGEMDKADTSEGGGKDLSNNLVTFSKNDLKKEYTKKGLIKAMVKTGIAKKEFIKAIKKRIEGKKILGQDFVAIMDDEYGDEFSSVDINRVFDEINLK